MGQEFGGGARGSPWGQRFIERKRWEPVPSLRLDGGRGGAEISGRWDLPDSLPGLLSPVHTWGGDSGGRGNWPGTSQGRGEGVEGAPRVPMGSGLRGEPSQGRCSLGRSVRLWHCLPQKEWRESPLAWSSPGAGEHTVVLLGHLQPSLSPACCDVGSPQPQARGIPLGVQAWAGGARVLGAPRTRLRTKALSPQPAPQRPVSAGTGRAQGGVHTCSGSVSPARVGNRRHQRQENRPPVVGRGDQRGVTPPPA